MPETIQALVLYKDSNLIVLNKPSGIPVHGGPSGAPALEDGFDALKFGTAPLPRAAHRLDRDTSGCLLLGRHDKAIKRLNRLFEAGEIAKTYWAILPGRPEPPAGTIDAPLLKRNDRTGWKIVVDPAGQRAISDYRVLGSDGAVSWVEFRPRTGRTHQIRVHAASIGAPVLGDSLYGGRAGLPLCLHAAALSLHYHADRPAVTVTAPPPAHMQPLLSACGWTGDVTGAAETAGASEHLPAIDNQRLPGDPAGGR